MKDLAIEPTDFSRGGETEGDLETTLLEIATDTARKLQARRCSILLVREGENKEKLARYLQIFAHYGDLARSDYPTPIPLDRGLAGTVVLTGKPLLIRDIRRSPFRALARYPDKNPSCLLAPLRLGDRVLGSIAVSLPVEKLSFDEPDLEILELFAKQAAQSLQIFHLRGMVKSRFVAMAVRGEIEADRAIDIHPETDLFEIAVPPHPQKLAKIVAKAFFTELTKAGFSACQVIEIATEVLNLLQKTLDRHKNRLGGRE